MCGIWASVGLEVGRERIDRVAHRGPDGSGWETFASPAGPVVLGHRRLAIIDTSEGGRQPMSDAHARYWLTFNGEIYNYCELRAELESKGIAFHTASDSEVLLRALIVWGEAALPRLNGMFAFGFYDSQRHTLLLARDRFGIKPLYFAQVGSGAAFASEIKQLYDLPGVSRRMNLRRVRDFLATGTADHSGETMFAGVGQLRGGECLRLDLSRPAGREPLPVRRWYQLPKPGSLTLSLEEAGARYRRSFIDAVRLQLRSDVPLGSCLSGGLDSSSIVAVASQQLGAGRPMTTVSAVFSHARVDERRYMEAVIAATGAKPVFTTVDPMALFQTAEEVIWHQDEPYGSTSIHAQWSVFGAARGAGLKVMLDGQGADEPLAGYHTMFGSALADRLMRFEFGAAVHQIRERQAVHGASIRAQLIPALPALVPTALRKHVYRLGRSARGPDWLDGAALAGLASLPDPIAQAASDMGFSGRPALANLTAMQTMATSLPMLLHWEDRSSMAHAIEARVPFLDHRLVELAIALGSAHKIEGARTKVLLREGMAGVLPDLVANRNDKLGFATPEQEWFCGPLAPQVRTAVRNTLDWYPGLLHRQGTEQLLDEMLGGRRRFNFSLWRIAAVGIWGKLFELTL